MMATNIPHRFNDIAIMIDFFFKFIIRTGVKSIILNFHKDINVTVVISYNRSVTMC